MSYQSPIEVIHTQMQSQIEEEIYKAVMRVGVSVDKDELLKALHYDRNQYQKGYNDRDSEIIRCRDCKYYELVDGIFPVCNKWAKGCQTEPDGYCFLGEETVKG